MTSQDDIKAESFFLHELSNALAVAQGHLHLIMMRAKKNPDAIKLEDVLTKVEASLVAMNRTIDLLNGRRDVVRNKVGDETKS
jgi:hypothetical protein